jgi:hypothetical protein
MPDPPLLERLTASDLFVLLWDDLGWSGDIGALAVLDGTALLDPDGQVRVELVRRQIESRLHLLPRFRQRLYDRHRDSAGRCGSTHQPSTSPTTLRSSRCALRLTKHSCCRPAPSWPGNG